MKHKAAEILPRKKQILAKYSNNLAHWLVVTLLQDEAFKSFLEFVMHHNTRRLNRIVPKASLLQKDQLWGHCSGNFLKICSPKILSATV